MQSTQQQNQISWLRAVRTSKPIQAFNRFCASPFGLAALGALTLLSYVFALELCFYAFVGVYVIYTCLFGEDLLAMVPLFLFCYIAPSAGNNPGKEETSIFYGSYGGIIILCLAAVVLAAVIFRIATDEEMGFKKLFTQERLLWRGFIAVGIAYMLSGIGSAHYFEIAGKNFFFAILQFLSLFLLYFLFSATIKWERVDGKYFAWMAIVFGLTVVGQTIHIYATQNVIADNIINGEVLGKKINRVNIYTGWGMYNNIGALIAIAIPFPLYLACTERHSSLFVCLSALMVVATIFTGSRGSMIGAVIAFGISYAFALVKSKNRKALIITVASLIGVAILLFFIFKKELATLFSEVPDLFKFDSLISDGGLGGFWELFNDSNRFSVYREGFKVFVKNPVFGDSFYPSEFVPWDFSELEQFSSFFPPRWHNTIVQLLASCGAVGLCAYLFHRVETVRLFCKEPSPMKTVIAISLGVLLLMSLLDCHMFNIGPVFFYSLGLLFAEKAGKGKETREEKME